MFFTHPEKGLTRVGVTHVSTVAKQAQRILVIEGGRLPRSKRIAGAR